MRLAVYSQGIAMLDKTATSLDLTAHKTKAEETQPGISDTGINVLELFRQEHDRLEYTAQIVKTAEDNALNQIQQSIESLQPYPAEIGAAALAVKLSKSIISGDIKNLEKLLDENKNLPEFNDALEQADTALLDIGIALTWDNKTECLTITDLEPFGLALKVSAQGKKTLAMEYRARPEADKDGPKGSLIYTEIESNAAKVASKLGQSATKALSKRHDVTAGAIESIMTIGAIQHAGGFDKKPVGKDLVTPLATALLESRLSPIVRAVQTAESDTQRSQLASKLNDLLCSVGLYADCDKEYGFMIGMYAEGENDGYVIHIPHRQEDPIKSYVLWGPKHQDPNKHIPYYRATESGDKEVTCPQAMRSLLRRMRQTCRKDERVFPLRGW